MGGLDIVKFTVREANQVAFFRSVSQNCHYLSMHKMEESQS